MARRHALPRGHPRDPSGTIAIVDIDARSLQEIGTWPWPRQIHASLIDNLRALGAAEIAFDVDFSTTSNAVDDAALAAALERAGGTVVLASFAQAASGRPGETARRLQCADPAVPRERLDCDRQCRPRPRRRDPEAQLRRHDRRHADAVAVGDARRLRRPAAWRISGRLLHPRGQGRPHPGDRHSARRCRQEPRRRKEDGDRRERRGASRPFSGAGRWRRFRHAVAGARRGNLASGQGARRRWGSTPLRGAPAHCHPDRVCAPAGCAGQSLLGALAVARGRHRGGRDVPAGTRHPACRYCDVADIPCGLCRCRGGRRDRFSPHPPPHLAHRDAQRAHHSRSGHRRQFRRRHRRGRGRRDPQCEPFGRAHPRARHARDRGRARR